MATIVNNPGSGDSGAGAAGWIVAATVLVAVILIGLFVWPGMGSRTTQVSIPDTIDVNVGGGAPAAGGQ